MQETLPYSHSNMSTWGNRLGSWASGRFSPFGGPTRENSVSGNQVTDQDFSYITAEDLERHEDSAPHHSQHDHKHHHHHHEDSSRRESRPSRDTDVLIFRNRNISYPVHFPAYAISDGVLTVGAAREQVARKLEIHDHRRIRMFWKGRNLKDDMRTCREEGLRSEDKTEILCVIGDSAHDTRGEGSDSGSEGSVDGRLDVDTADGKARKKKRSRPKKKKNRKSGLDSASGSGTSSPVPVAEHLPIPSSAHPAHRASATPSAASRGVSPQPPPQTPLAKLAVIADKFNLELKPAATAYMANPPSDKAKREFEHKKHAETILAQILIKLDGVETEGDEDARAKRKALVKDVQAFLNKLDAFVK